MKKTFALSCIIGLIAVALYFTSPKNDKASAARSKEDAVATASQAPSSFLQLLPEAETRILESMSHAHARLAAKIMGFQIEVRGFANEGGKIREIHAIGLMVLPQYYVIVPALGFAKVQHIALTWEGISYPASYFAQDVESGITILKTEGKTLPAVELAPSSNLGEFVTLVRYDHLLKAMGISSGIISRSSWAPIRPGFYEIPLLAVEAPRPRDSSVGFLFNLRGQLVGVETIVYGSPSSTDVSYAMSGSHIQWLFRMLDQHGRIVRGGLGADFQDLDGELAQALGVKQKFGVLISGITVNSMAARAGLKEGDVIISAMGTETRSAQKLRQMIGQVTPGTEIEIRIIRDNIPATLRVQVEEATPPPVEAADLRRPLK